MSLLDFLRPCVNEAAFYSVCVAGGNLRLRGEGKNPARPAGERRVKMSEVDLLTEKLKKQQQQLLSVIHEAEVKIAEYMKALEEGKQHLAKVESVLKTFGEKS